MKTGKNRKWTWRRGDEFVQRYSIGELGSQLSMEINKYIKEADELAEKIKGFTDCGTPLVVDEYKLEEILEVWNCCECLCQNYCHKHRVNSRDECKSVKKMYLMGKLKGYEEDFTDEADTDNKEEEE